MTREEAQIARSAITTFDGYQGITVDALRQGAAEVRMLVHTVSKCLENGCEVEDLDAMILGIAGRLDAAASLAIKTDAFDVQGGGQ